MFWVGIIGDKLYGPFRVPEAVKLLSIAYTVFLGEQLLQRLDGISLSLWFKVDFMHGNVPSRAAMSPTSFLESQVFVRKPLWLGRIAPPDLNPIGRLRSILKRGVYEGGEQFTSKDAFWNKIVDVARTITSCLTKGQRVVQISLKNVRYVGKYVLYMRLSLENVSCVCFL